MFWSLNYIINRHLMWIVFICPINSCTSYSMWVFPAVLIDSGYQKGPLTLLMVFFSFILMIILLFIATSFIFYFFCLLQFLFCPKDKIKIDEIIHHTYPLSINLYLCALNIHPQQYVQFLEIHCDSQWKWGSSYPRFTWS